MSNNEPQKKKMEKRKSNGVYENYKKKRAKQKKLSRKKVKYLVTASQTKQHKVKRKLEQRLCRQRKKEWQIMTTTENNRQKSNNFSYVIFIKCHRPMQQQ